MLFEDDNLLKDYCEMRGIDYNQYIEFIGNDEKVLYGQPMCL